MTTLLLLLALAANNYWPRTNTTADKVDTLIVYGDSAVVVLTHWEQEPCPEKLLGCLVLHTRAVHDTLVVPVRKPLPRNEQILDWLRRNRPNWKPKQEMK